MCLHSPGFFTSKSVLRCRVEGRSLRRSDSCLLKGEFFWLRAGNPLNEPWRTSCSMGAWRRGIAWGPPGSGRSIGDAVPSGGEAEPGGRDGTTEGGSKENRDKSTMVYKIFLEMYLTVKRNITLNVNVSCRDLEHFPTFLFILRLFISLTAAALLAGGGVDAKGAFTHKRGATGVKGSRHATLLLSSLLSLQTGSKGTADCMTQSLTLV